jgi:hypothetical protein
MTNAKKTEQSFDKQRFLDMAKSLEPVLIEKVVYPARLIRVEADASAFQGWKTAGAGNADELKEQAFGKNESLILDFGDHQVGYLSLSIRPRGNPPDAPLKMKLVFGEMPCEVGEPFEEYNGWLSSSWLQEETVFVDVLPGVVGLPRRYSFRYLKIMILDTSPRYKISFEEISCMAVTSADTGKVEPLPADLPEEWKEMDRIGIKTLQDCMQDVFEDGPKRDRRLWIGDLRLQALVNYHTFRNYDLVKRCLCLFAGLTDEDGRVEACLYTKPDLMGDRLWLYDYSLFFVAALSDYFKAAGDREFLCELWPVALKQLELSMSKLGEDGVVKDEPTWWCFIDWHQELNKQASAQAVLIYCLRRGLELAGELRLEEESRWIAAGIEKTANAALKHLWNAGEGFFVSGAERQVSWASQIWMALAEVLDAPTNAALLDRLFEKNPPVGISTPYMYHHLIEALILNGRKDKALEQMQRYWGGMVRDGADCFWELYNPENKLFSPYGSNLINSYCHAWSCTPSYFIRKYYRDSLPNCW